MRALLRGSVLLLALGLFAAPARGQSVALQPLREALASYEGARTLGALRELSAAASRGSESERKEARFLRAAVATDLVIAATVDPAHAALLEQVADALGVSREGLAAHLRGELAAVQSGVYRGPATAALSALALRDALAAGTAIAWAQHAGPRRDLLLLWASASGAPAMADPCSAERACPEPYAQLDAGARRELAGLAEVSAAARRVEAASRGGDPLAALLVSHAGPASERVVGAIVHAAPRVPESFPITASDAAGEALRPGLVIAIGEGAVRVARPASYGVREGRPVVRESGDDVLPGSTSIALPADGRPIDALIEALRRHTGEGGIALAVAPGVPAQVVRRVIASAVRAERAPTVLVRRAPDGTLRGAAITLVPAAEAGAPGDLVLRLRLGGYALTRGRGAETSLPKVRDAGGRSFDLEGLRAALARMPHRRVVIDPMGSIAASDVLDAAFLAAQRGSAVALVN